MQQRYYTNERNELILMALLKGNNIKRVITSPGSTNHTLVASMQNDPYFELYSCVDERSAAYMACGLAAESGEPVVMTCTEATASRNYMPALTEAYYRKLPVLAIATTHGADKVGQQVAQVLDHSQLPNDVAVYSCYVPTCRSRHDDAKTERVINEAILSLTHHGSGPVYICMETQASRDYSVKELPKVTCIRRLTYGDELPTLPEGRIGIKVGSHKMWKKEETEALETFCAVNNAVVFCDHTSGYYGRYRVDSSLIGSQDNYVSPLFAVRLLIHLGEVSGDYFSNGIGVRAQEVWRLSEDGKVTCPFGKLHKIFEMSERLFFEYYSKDKEPVERHIIDEYKAERDRIKAQIPELPWSKVWVASQIVPNLPPRSYIHFSILGSLRAGNFFELPEGVQGNCNVGGFGIDGATSTLIGAALVNPDRLHFLMTGDLAFFYDLNAIGNRHVGRNVRILLVNNGDGTEFRMYWHPCSAFSKEECDRFMSAGGHNGHMSPALVRHMAEDLGFEYLTSSSKEEFEEAKKRFLCPDITDRPVIFEVFTDSETDNEAVHTMRTLAEDDGWTKRKLKQHVQKAIKGIVGNDAVETVKSMIRK